MRTMGNDHPWIMNLVTLHEEGGRLIYYLPEVHWIVACHTKQVVQGSKGVWIPLLLLAVGGV